MIRNTALTTGGIIALALYFGPHETGHAHGMDTDRMSMRLHGDTLRITLTPSTALLRGFDDNADGRIGSAEVQKHRSAMIAHILAGLTINDEHGQAPSPTLSDLNPTHVHAGAAPSDHVRVTVYMRWKQEPEQIYVRWAYAAIAPLNVQAARPLPSDSARTWLEWAHFHKRANAHTFFTKAPR